MSDSHLAAYINPASKPELNPDFYNNLLQPHEVAFFKQQTGIQDDESLKQHIIRIQSKAYEVRSTYSLLGLMLTWQATQFS